MANKDKASNKAPSEKDARKYEEARKRALKKYGSEAISKDYFENDFGVWLSRKEGWVHKDGKWRRAKKSGRGKDGHAR